MIKHQPRPSRTALVSLAAVGISMAIAAQSASQVAQESIEADAAHIASQQISDCRTEVDGQAVDLMVGQSVQGAKEWRNCVTYDGQPAIVYSARPSKSIALASID